MFACRTCRREVTVNEDGTAQHKDGTDICVLELAGMDTTGWQGWEPVDNPATVLSEEDYHSKKKK